MYLGIDLGTSSVKALLMDDNQRLIASASSSLSVDRPHPGWCEQDPADWIAATGAAIDALRKDHPKGLAAVRGIGLSGHMHGATLLDGAGEVLRPCILWNDTRSHAEAAALDSRPEFREVSGNIVFPGFTAPKVVWVAKHEPRVFEKVSKVLLPKDYLRFWLTGEHVSDLSDAAGTSWLDVGARGWSGGAIGGDGFVAESHAEAGRGKRCLGRAARRSGAHLGHGWARRGGGRVGRQCGLGHRHGGCRAGRIVSFTWHIGRAVCGE